MTHLDWHDGSHWSVRSAPCVHCGGFTRLLNDDGLPAHKVCAEGELAEDLMGEERRNVA